MRQIIAENATFFEKMTACFGDFSQFEQNIQQIAQFAEIDLHQYEIDHLAVRMNRPETAKGWQHLLEQSATLCRLALHSSGHNFLGCVAL